MDTIKRMLGTHLCGNLQIDEDMGNIVDKLNETIECLNALIEREGSSALRYSEIIKGDYRRDNCSHRFVCKYFDKQERTGEKLCVYCSHYKI